MEARPAYPDEKTASRSLAVAVLRGGMAALVLRTVSMGGQFASNVLLARYLGAGGAGAFFLAFTMALVASTLGRLGIDTSLLRFSAVTSDRRAWPDTAALYRSAVGTCTLASAAITMVLLAVASPISQLAFHQVHLVTPVRALAIGVIPLSVGALSGEFLKGIGRVATGVLVETAGVPLLLIPAFVVAGAVHGGVTGFCVAYGAVSAAIMILGILMSWFAIPATSRMGGQFDWATLMRTSMPLFVISLSSLMMTWSAVLILGLFEPPRIVGIFSVALRSAQLVAWPLAATNSVVAPRLAALFARHDQAGARHLVRLAMMFNTILGSAVWVVMVVDSGTILRLFGSGFAAGRGALIVLATGQLVNVCMGPVGYVLTMSGHQKEGRNITVVLAIVGIGLTVVLARVGGMMGAAVAMALTVVALNLVLAEVGHRRTGVPAVCRSWRKDAS